MKSLPHNRSHVQPGPALTAPPRDGAAGAGALEAAHPLNRAMSLVWAGFATSYG